MSRSPVACSCGTVLADRRHTGTVIRRGVQVNINVGLDRGIKLTCPVCGRVAELLQKKVVAFDVR
jgi:hypothetical protein